MITTLQGRTQKVEISPEGPTVIIGERLNSTGHSRLAEALRKGDWDLIRQEATSQVEQGAALIDINVGATGVDEKNCGAYLDWRRDRNGSFIAICAGYSFLVICSQRHEFQHYRLAVKRVSRRRGKW